MATVTLTDAVDAVAAVPAVTVTPRGRTIPLTDAVDAVGAVPAVTVLAGTVVALTSAVAAVAAVPAVTVDAAGKHVGLTSVAAVGGVPAVSVASASSVVIADAVDAVAAVPAVTVVGTKNVSPVAVAAVGAVPAVLVVANALDIGTIPAPDLVGPFIEEGAIDDSMEVETIPRASMATGPVWIANDDASPFSPTLTAILIEEDGVTEVAGDLLANAFNLTWLDELNGPGYGSLDIPLSETAAIAALTLHRLVRFYVAFSDSAGSPAVEAFCWQIEEHPQFVSVDQSEEYGQIMRVRGRGWAVVLNESIVYPPIPVGEVAVDLTSPFLGPDRVFSFASPDYPDLWGSPGDWPLVKSGYRWETLQPFRYERVETYEDVWESLPSPVGLPWPTSEVYPNILNPNEQAAHWIWPTVDPNKQGWAFFIGDLVYPDLTRPITFTTTADNLFTFFIDGTPLLGERLDTAMWKGWKEFTTTILKQRKYRVACVVQNTAGLAPNPGGWLLAATYASADGVIQDWAMTTNGAWRGYYSADVWPGWTAGQIMLKLVAEANTRAAAAGSPQHFLDYDFTGTSDSDGKSWAITIDGQTTLQIPWFQVSLGSTYLELLDQLHQDGWVNWRMKCAGLILQMWSYDAIPQDSGAVYAAGTNIMSLERSSNEEAFANVLLVSYEGGFVEVQAASAATDGRHEDVLQSDATDEVEAIRIGNHELAHRALDAEGGSIVIEIEPVDDTDFTDTPYLGFFPGDAVTIPSLQGGTALVQVLSISVKQDGMGDPTFILELNKRWPVESRDTNRLLRSIGGKSLGSAGTRGKVT